MADGTIRDHRAAIPELLAMADKLVEDELIRPGYFVYFLADRTYPGDPEKAHQALVDLDLDLQAQSSFLAANTDCQQPRTPVGLPIGQIVFAHASRL